MPVTGVSQVQLKPYPLAINLLPPWYYAFTTTKEEMRLIIPLKQHDWSAISNLELSLVGIVNVIKSCHYSGVRPWLP